MELLFLLAHTLDEDALVLLVLAVPTFILIFYALWIAVGREYQSDGGEWTAVDEEDES